MIETIIHFKWQILLFSEIFAWIFLIPMAYFRYWKPNKSLFIASTVLSGILGYVPHISIPYLIYLKQGNIKALYNSSADTLFFILFIVCLFVFGFTLGKKYVKLIDHWLFQKAQQAKQKSIKQTKFIN